MAKLIHASFTNGARLLSDPFVLLEPGDAVAASGRDAVLVHLADWQARRATLLASGQKLGVELSGGDDPEALDVDLKHLALVAVRFESFTDGRGYSSGRLLRERHGFTGELRAVGDILRDQVFYLVRCGFDSLALRDDQDVAACINALGDFREVYQGAVDRPTPLYARRSVALAQLESTGESA